MFVSNTLFCTVELKGEDSTPHKTISLPNSDRLFYKKFSHLRNIHLDRALFKNLMFPKK